MCQAQDQETNEEGQTGHHQDSSPASQVGDQPASQASSYTGQSPAGGCRKVKTIDKLCSSSQLNLNLSQLCLAVSQLPVVRSEHVRTFFLLGRIKAHLDDYMYLSQPSVVRSEQDCNQRLS